jgi:photosystem II stability/assembly factor-like uncharacterized protein
MALTMSRSLFGLLIKFLFVLPSIANAQIQWAESSTGCEASLRGISVVGEETIWACGAAATVVRSSDGGKTWEKCGPGDYQGLEFRSIAACNERQATIASAGTPAVILQTSDGGKTWKQRYRNEAKTAFFDGLKFWNSRNGTGLQAKHGIAFSDPIEGRFLIVTTNDSGNSWQAVDAANSPQSRENEAAFAASNSALLVGENGLVWIGTGGTVSDHSRVLFSQDSGQHWSSFDCPISSGQAAGIFSLAATNDQKTLVAVGGDYRPEELSRQTAAISRDGGRTWQIAAKPPTEFVSAVAIRAGRLAESWIAVGPTASFVSSDGDHWERFSNTGFHAIAISNSGTVFAVGSAGRFAISTGK